MQAIVWILFIVFIFSRIMKNAKKAARGTHVPPASNLAHGRADFYDALDALEMDRDVREEAEQPFMAYEGSAREEPKRNDYSPLEELAAFDVQRVAERPEAPKPTRQNYNYNLGAFRHAVVMAEILSPPKALRRR